MHCLRQYEATLWWNHTRMNMWSSFLLLVVLHNTQYGMKIDTSFHLMECHLNLQSQYNNQNDNSGWSINNHRDEFHMALWRYDYFLFWTGIKRMVSVWYAWNIFKFPNIPQPTFFLCVAMRFICIYSQWKACSMFKSSSYRQERTSVQPANTTEAISSHSKFRLKHKRRKHCCFIMLFDVPVGSFCCHWFSTESWRNAMELVPLCVFHSGCYKALCAITWHAIHYELLTSITSVCSGSFSRGKRLPRCRWHRNKWQWWEINLKPQHRSKSSFSVRLSVCHSSSQTNEYFSNFPQYFHVIKWDVWFAV